MAERMVTAKKKKVSIRAIAESLGVSSATVSLVLNGRARDYGLSEATEARVQLKAAEMGYSLARSRRGRFSILIASLGELYRISRSSFVVPILDPLVADLIEHGWQVMVSPHGLDGSFGVTPQMLAHASVVVVPTYGGGMERVRELVHEARELGVVPLVVGRIYEDLDALFVDIGIYAGAQAVARHFYELGHRRVALVLGIQGDQHSEARQKGFCDFYADHGAPVPPEMIWGYGHYQTTGGHRLTLEHLRQTDGPRPTAIFYVNDLMALGGYYALREAGVRVPEEISIAGYDEDNTVAGMEPALTTVGVEAGGLGRRLAQVLMDMARTGAADRMQVLCPARLIVRDSTVPPPLQTTAS